MIDWMPVNQAEKNSSKYFGSWKHHEHIKLKALPAEAVAALQSLDVREDRILFMSELIDPWFFLFFILYFLLLNLLLSVATVAFGNSRQGMFEIRKAKQKHNRLSSRVPPTGAFKQRNTKHKNRWPPFLPSRLFIPPDGPPSRVNKRSLASLHTFASWIIDELFFFSFFFKSFPTSQSAPLGLQKCREPTAPGDHCAVRLRLSGWARVGIFGFWDLKGQSRARAIFVSSHSAVNQFLSSLTVGCHWCPGGQRWWEGLAGAVTQRYSRHSVQSQSHLFSRMCVAMENSCAIIFFFF